MAFESQGREPVKFNGVKDENGKLVSYSITELPALNAEIKLRIQSNMSGTGISDALIEAIAAAFPIHKSEIKEFIKNEMFDQDIMELASYLTGGKKMLERYNKFIENATEKMIDKNMAEQVNV